MTDEKPSEEKKICTHRDKDLPSHAKYCDMKHPQDTELCQECEFRVGKNIRLSAALDALDVVEKLIMVKWEYSQNKPFTFGREQALARARDEIRRRYG